MYENAGSMVFFILSILAGFSGFVNSTPNILMIGPPGSGKTMLAKRVPTILPDLTPSESIETTRIYSAVGRLKPGQPLLAVRPFRSPHHTISDAGLSKCAASKSREYASPA